MECITSVRVLIKIETQNMCEYYACVCVCACARPCASSGARVTPSHPVTAALHPRLPPFRSHHQQADYSLATVTLFTPYAATNYRALTPELSRLGSKGWGWWLGVGWCRGVG